MGLSNLHLIKGVRHMCRHTSSTIATYNIQHQMHWVWLELEDVYFVCLERCPLNWKPQHDALRCILPDKSKHMCQNSQDRGRCSHTESENASLASSEMNQLESPAQLSDTFRAIECFKGVCAEDTQKRLFIANDDGYLKPS